MTEQEAVKEIERHIQFLRENWKPHPDYNVIEALGMAITELEEIQQYRAIGTVEECREARAKQEAKKPNIWGDGYADGVLVYDMYDCPNCGKHYELDYEEYDYCPKCGQKLDWSDKV